MANRQSSLVVFKLFFGLLALSSLVTEIVVLLGRGTFVSGNFFSFFTVESNLFAAFVLIASAACIMAGKQPAGLRFVRGAATLYMMITGIVFSILLSGLDAELTAVPWDNIVLHYIMPVVMVIDWFVDPPHRKIKAKDASLWLLFPLLYLVYSLVRGQLTGWYPYPFLNAELKGYSYLATVSVGILLLSVALVFILIAVRRSKK